MKEKLKKHTLTLTAILFWIAVWHITGSIANKNLLFAIPLPADTLAAFFSAIKTARFWAAVGTSLFHISAGFISACVLGLIFGVISGSLAGVRALSAPLIHLMRSVPVAAFIILAWLWIPTNILPAFISFLMVFPLIFSRAEEDILNTDKHLLELSRVMRLSPFKTMLHIKLPSVLPGFRLSAINGLGFAWKSGVAAEVICNPTGSLGALLSGAKMNIEYAEVFAITLTIVLLSLFLENIIKLVWKEKKYD